MHLEQHQHGDVVVVTLTGRLTSENVDLLRDKLASLIFQGETHIVLDLAGVRYIDSAGLGALIGAASNAERHGARVVLANATGRTRDLLVLTKLLTVFDTYPGVAEAEASFDGNLVPVGAR
ncbi:MAG TPA: STAS domain-containing protein [Vicinamibacterales bacterium]|jgi:anti-sigma B factor antagonist